MEKDQTWLAPEENHLHQAHALPVENLDLY
jgi:hypothetical protein